LRYSAQFNKKAPLREGSFLIEALTAKMSVYRPEFLVLAAWLPLSGDLAPQVTEG